MNAPIKLAQVTGAVSGPASAIKILKITKPPAGQAVTENASYDGTVQVDFSGIAKEKIRLIHIGESLIILFDDQATVTIVPFFDSMGVPLANIVVVSDGRELASAEFASTFPMETMTAEQLQELVLPAAGEGDGPRPGANFSNATTEPLVSWDPLPLLPEEFLPPIEFTRIEPVLVNENPVPAPGANEPLLIDEDDIDNPPGFSQGIGNTDSPGDDPTIVSGFLSLNSLDPVASVTFASMDGDGVEGTDSAGN